MIEKYNLKGAGSWSLHQATQDIWNVYNHWAKKDVEIAVQHKLMLGLGNHRFAPDESLTREEMATLLDRIKNIIP